MEDRTNIHDRVDALHSPRTLTCAENVLLTAKLLAIAGILGAVLWGLNHWTLAK